MSTAIRHIQNSTSDVINEKEKIDFSLYKTSYMCTFIKMEYLVANALVSLYERKNINKISLEDIRKYGVKVEEELNTTTNSRAILLYSNNYTREFLQDYSDWFEMIDDYIKIKDGVAIDDIREHILSYISMDILIALLNVNSLKVIHAV